MVEHPNPPKPNAEHPFLWNWVVANIVGLPVLLGVYSVGLILLLGIAILSDGSAPARWYVYSFLIASLCGAVLGALFGHIQSLPLKARIPQSGKWIGATSIGVAIGTPVSWIIYNAMLSSSLLDRLHGLSVYYVFQSIMFGGVLGLAVGAAQAFVLEPQIRKATLWMVATPILFTGGMIATKIGLVYLLLMRSVYQLIEGYTNRSPEIRFPAVIMHLFFRSCLLWWPWWRSVY